MIIRKIAPKDSPVFRSDSVLSPCEKHAEALYSARLLPTRRKKSIGFLRIRHFQEGTDASSCPVSPTVSARLSGSILISSTNTGVSCSFPGSGCCFPSHDWNKNATTAVDAIVQNAEAYFICVKVCPGGLRRLVNH